MASIKHTVFVSSSAEFYNLKHPKHNLKLNIGGKTAEAAIIQFSHTATTVPKPSRDVPGKMRSAAQWNNDYRRALLNNAKKWEGILTPAYAVLFKDKNVYQNAIVYGWRPDIITVEGQVDCWDFPIVGTLTGVVSEGIYQVEETVTVQIEGVKPYTGDKFHISDDGHYVSDVDGFVVPKDFMEFYTAYPLYVRRWSSKWLHKNDPNDENVRDWEQELLLYLHYLPETSKSRKPTDRYPNGRTDVIQCFDPLRQYGASERRFRNYLNICLHNRSATMAGKMKKNPMNCKNNLPFSVTVDENSTTTFTVDDEYLHKHSEILTKRSEETVKTIDKKLLVQKFTEFVQDNEPNLMPTLIAIAETKTLREAMDILGVNEQTFQRDKKRIITLREAFMGGWPIQKQRKQYKKRQKT